jgi:hypothetical protein
MKNYVIWGCMVMLLVLSSPNLGFANQKTPEPDQQFPKEQSISKHEVGKNFKGLVANQKRTTQKTKGRTWANRFAIASLVTLGLSILFLGLTFLFSAFMVANLFLTFMLLFIEATIILGLITLILVGVRALKNVQKNKKENS